MNESDVILRLQNLQAGKTQADVAKRLGVSVQYLSDVLNGRRQPGEKILSALGLERVTTYRRKRDA